MAERNTGLKTIAYELNLSVNTVSRALRDCSDISENTKRLVRKKAFELGYVQSNVAKFLKREEKKLIAIVVNNLHNLFFSIICEKLTYLAYINGYDYTIITTFSDVANSDLIKQCISQRVDGIISSIRLSEKAIDVCKLNSIPVSLVGMNIAEDDYCDSVSADFDSGVNIISNYMVKYHKLHKIIYVHNDTTKSSDDRFIKLEAAINNLSSDITFKKMTIKEISEDVSGLIKKGYFGYICFNDELAYDLLNKLNKAIPNIRIIYPKLHLISFDALCTKLTGLIDLTSVDYDFDLMAKTSFELLEDKFNNPDKKEKVQKLIPVSLHQRKLF